MMIMMMIIMIIIMIMIVEVALNIKLHNKYHLYLYFIILKHLKKKKKKKKNVEHNNCHYCIVLKLLLNMELRKCLFSLCFSSNLNIPEVFMVKPFFFFFFLLFLCVTGRKICCYGNTGVFDLKTETICVVYENKNFGNWYLHGS